MAAYTYRIHPAIGVARVGNSEAFYLGPETMAGLPVEGNSTTTGGLPIKPGTASDTIASSDLRDSSGAFKRQAARFKIFQYSESGTASYPTGEGTEIHIGSTVDGKMVKDIVWTVHLANKKASTYVLENPHLQPDDLIIVGYENGHLPPLRNVPEGADPNNTERLKKLTIDPGPRTISGKSAPAVAVDKTTTASYWNGTGLTPLPDYPKSFPGDAFPQLECPVGPIETLGALQTDNQGRLLVLAAYGRACAWYNGDKPYALDHAVDNDGWFDDTADGPVSAVLVFDDNSSQAVHGAWVVATDPSYAPQTLNVVSLWDDIYDTWVRKLGLSLALFDNGAFNPSFKPSFADHIYPMFRSAALQRWNTNLPVRAISAHDAVGSIKETDDPSQTRLAGLRLIRNPTKPAEASQGAPRMPLSLGDQGQPFLSPSLTQYFFLQQWNTKHFGTGPGPKLGPGEYLDKAILVNCLGGRFSPGIDMTFTVRQPDMYMQDWQTSGAGPFRIKPKPLPYGNAQSGQPVLTQGYVPLHTGNAGLEPGDASKFMALPWHTDYNSCATHKTDPNPNTSLTLYWSWPAQRPIAVYAAKDVKDGQLGAQRYSVRGVGTASPNPANQGRYQDYLNMVKNFHQIGVVIQGTAIDSSDGGPFDQGYYLEVQSQLDDSGDPVTPWPMKASE